MKIFYAWQSELPARGTRNLIEDALKGAAKDLNATLDQRIEAVVDRDTRGVPGAPEIVATILEKIREANAFVADVSLVGAEGGRPTPNANVLLELGYALGVLGPNRIVCVMNEAHGGVEHLPFDLRGRRVQRYQADSSSELSSIRKDLRRQLFLALDLVRALPPRRQDIRVEVHRMIPLQGGAPAIVVAVKNFSDQPLHFASVAFQLKRGVNLWPARDIFGQPQSSQTIEPRNAHKAFFSIDELLAHAPAKEFERVFATDALGNEYELRGADLERALLPGSERES